MTLSEMNLDGMSATELWDVWKLTNTVRPIALARELFPTSPKGYVRAAKNLGHYACNKAVAMQSRLEGNIQTALMYEAICDRIYSELPEYAKW